MNEPLSSAPARPPATGADLDRAVRHYDMLAPVYDHATRRIDGVRAQAIVALGLKPGDVVLDAGCGTGFCFALIEDAIGPSSKLIGIDPSPAMLALARKRADASGWANVTLLHASGESVRLPEAPDAVLFSYTHDLLRSPPGLDNLFGQCRPDASVAAAGTWRTLSRPRRAGRAPG